MVFTYLSILLFIIDTTFWPRQEGSQIPHLLFIAGVTLAIHKDSGTDTLMTGYTAWPAVHGFTFEFLHDFQENVIQSWWLINIQGISLVLFQE